jgi:ATP-dependent DNA ligase
MLNGRDLRAEPLIDRRRRLRDLIGVEMVTRVHFSGEHVGDGPAFFKAADQHGLEGIVSKRADSRYTSGRAKTWLKIKSFTVGDYAVLGVEQSSTGIPVALLATLGRSPEYVGNAMVTLPTKERAAFWSSVEKMGTPQSRLAGLAKNKKAKWIREGLVARVRHLRGEEKLRHATMQSLDVDKPIRDDLGERHGDEE